MKRIIIPIQPILESTRSIALVIIAVSLIQISFYLKGKDFSSEYNYYVSEIIVDDTKVTDMRITGYLPTGNKTALGENVVVGRTAAVSNNCSYLLGEKVYIKGHGVRYVNDITASWLDEEFGICTLDLAVPNEQEALKIGNSTSTVVRITKD